MYVFLFSFFSYLEAEEFPNNELAIFGIDGDQLDELLMMGHEAISNLHDTLPNNLVDNELTEIEINYYEEVLNLMNIVYSTLFEE